ncbi:NAD(P)-dependent alcohol dehydrogenase [Streptomyces virginiae]|uniref:NAD(P)-dependent alcohol dehydrogenase n=1 Tax=Streptomyces virginiae TaxID=1961 RepID=UPI002256072B|nr:NAD(P)-dependent alcohol dehydrogenase [Streptomyces virginiae]MCX4718808.1 NAD(P)-dependent alcohol dehydrogenase [Streptomyces virginiae]MCX5276447.1 NAD(P)-dependent alcohol dehydrogenase [Streptomyces virginiae]
MKAIVQDVYGPPEVLRMEEMERPVPGRREVLVRVRAAGVDQGVWHLMAGLPYAVRAVSGLRTPRSRVRGMDVAGVVEAVGPDVTRFRPGDEVYGNCSGSFAEYACAKEGSLAPKPAGLSFEQAAAVPVSACTALGAVRDSGQVKAGQRVLVLGASGGVGSFAVQVAKAYGAHVTGVCSTTKTDLVRSLGADEVLDYTRQDPVDGTHRYDVILDIAGNRPISRLRRALTPRGTLAIVGGEGGGNWIGGNQRQLGAMLLTPFVGHRLRAHGTLVRSRDLEALTELIEAGSVTPAVDRIYPLAEVPDAIRYLRDGQVRGKVAIRL